MSIAIQLLSASEMAFIRFLDSYLKMCNCSLSVDYQRRHVLRGVLRRKGGTRIPKDLR